MTRQRPIPALAQTLLLAVFGVVAIHAALIPLGTGRGLAVPDLLYCLVIAWVIRRPGSAPFWLVLVLGLLGDVLLSRPIGLGALGLLAASEAMRANARLFHGTPFVIEWLAAVAAFALLLAAMQLLLRLAFADAPGLQGLVPHLMATAIAYPVVAAGLVWGLRLRAPRGGRTGDRLGRIP